MSLSAIVSQYALSPVHTSASMVESVRRGDIIKIAVRKLLIGVIYNFVRDKHVLKFPLIRSKDFSKCEGLTVANTLKYVTKCPDCERKGEVNTVSNQGE